jgi:hypothetical protein
VESLFRVGSVIYNVQFSLLIEKSVSSLDVSFVTSLFIPELTVVSGNGNGNGKAV